MNVVINRRLAILVFLLSYGLPSSTSLAAIRIKVCQHKNCMKQYQNGNLVETFKNLIGPESLHTNIEVQSCGCLSGCGKGPNVSIEMKDYEKIHGAVEDPLAAALLLNAECSYRSDNMLIAACNVIAQARELRSTEKKDKFLSSVISSLSNHSELQTSNALVSAYIERAQVRIVDPSTIEDAVEDCRKAIDIDTKNGKAWRTLAEALEALGDTLGALEAVTEWAKVDELLFTKARKEMDRLNAKL